jgi:hypothetical protein
MKSKPEGARYRSLTARGRVWNVSVRRTLLALVLVALGGCAFHSGPWRMPSHQLTRVEYTNDQNYCLDRSFTFPVPAPFPPPRWSMMAPPETYAFNRCMRAQGYAEVPSGEEAK